MDKFHRENYAPDDIAEVRKNLGIREEDKVVLYIGRISQEKNIAEVIDGYAEYAGHRKDVRLLIVGGGPELDRLKEQAEHLGIQDKVIFAGARPWDEIGKYYFAGDVFVSASQSETQGLTYIEAMAAGLPVVAKKDACLNGIVENGVNGYQITSKEEFVRALDDVLNPDKWKEYSRQALLAVRPYSKESFADSILSLYAEIRKERR